MPLPEPHKRETQDEYIKRFLKVAKNEFSSHEQCLAVAYSKWKKRSGKKECIMNIIEYKETDDGDLIVKGYIATTHLDSGFYDDKREVYVRDRITKETLEEWANELNEGNPRANKVSINHNRDPHVAGVAIKGTAHVKRFKDGEYGLYVETLVDKTREDFFDTKYRIENDLLDSYSIEFTTKDPMTGEAIPDAIEEYSVEDGMVRELMPSTKLQGYTLASQPMNEYAVMVKEMFGKNNDFINFKEEKRMRKEEMEEAETTEEEEDEDEENPSGKKPVSKKGVRPAEMAASDGVAPATHNTYYGAPKKAPYGYSAGGKEISSEDMQLLYEAKEKKKKDEMNNLIKDAVKEAIKSQLGKVQVEDKTGKDNPDIEAKEVTEYMSILKDSSKISIKEQFRIAARLAEKQGLINQKSWVKPTSSPAESREFKFTTNGNKLEFKSLGMVTNQNTNANYLLSAAELQDSFDPVIYNALNQQTVTWNILNKDDYSNKGNNQVQFVLKTAANTTAAFYTGNAITTGNVTRLKLETKFKKAQVGVEVDGDMIAAARGGPIGDVFAQEVMDSTIDLLSVMNQALFSITGNAAGTGAPGAETDAMPISFLYLANSATYTTLYNITRSTTNKLSPASAGDTYINQASARISLTNLRAAKRQALKDGSMIQNLVFVCNHTQADLFRAIYDAIQRTVPTSSRFGFEGRPDFDGIPIFEDKDCVTTDWWLADLDSLRIAIWVPPTLEMLGKDADSQKGFIKCYYALYCRNPRRFVNIYGCATS